MYKMKETIKSDAQVCGLDAWKDDGGIDYNKDYRKKRQWMFLQYILSTTCIPRLFLGTDRKSSGINKFPGITDLQSTESQKVSFQKAAGHLNLN